MDSNYQSNEKKQISDEIYTLLKKEMVYHKEVVNKLNKLVDKYGNEACIILFEILTYIAFTPEEAEKHWKGVLENYDILCSTMNRDVGIRVAILDYFININKRLNNPLMIELALFHRAQENALIDPLTTLYNRRHLNDVLRKEFSRVKRFNQQLSVIFLDIDYFKMYNDFNGHVAGDAALKKVAEIMKSSAREIDTIFRYGGEEFIIVCPRTSKDDALILAERIRKRVYEEDFHGADQLPDGRLTISGGIANIPLDTGNIDNIIGLSDKAMYDAKRLGRNYTKLYFQEKRAFTRINTEINVSFHEAPRSMEDHKGITKNISQGGILFETDKMLDIGTRLEVNLTPQKKKVGVSAFGRVVRVEDIGEGKFDIGTAFTDMTPEQQKDLLNIIQGL